MSKNDRNRDRGKWRTRKRICQAFKKKRTYQRYGRLPVTRKN